MKHYKQSNALDGLENYATTIETHIPYSRICLGEPLLDCSLKVVASNYGFDTDVSVSLLTLLCRMQVFWCLGYKLGRQTSWRWFDVLSGWYRTEGFDRWYSVGSLKAFYDWHNNAEAEAEAANTTITSSDQTATSWVKSTLNILQVVSWNTEYLTPHTQEICLFLYYSKLNFNNSNSYGRWIFALF